MNGFNISIIAGLFSGLSARLFGRRRAMPLAVTGIILYTLLVGASAAVVRAAIMGSLYVIAIHYGRQSDALNSLMAAAILMTALNPFTLWDLGFQLSFAATLGLVLYTPVVQGWFEGGLRRLLSEEATQKAIGLLNEALIVTLAAQSAIMVNSIWGLRPLDRSRAWRYNKVASITFLIFVYKPQDGYVESVYRYVYWKIVLKSRQFIGGLSCQLSGLFFCLVWGWLWEGL